MTPPKNLFYYLCGAIVIYILLAYNHCVDVSCAWFRLLRPIENDIVFCVGTVEGKDYAHMWLRVNGHNIETTTLNLFKSRKVDYATPFFISDDIDLVRSTFTS